MLANSLLVFLLLWEETALPNTVEEAILKKPSTTGTKTGTTETSQKKSPPPREKWGLSAHSTLPRTNPTKAFKLPQPWLQPPSWTLMRKHQRQQFIKLYLQPQLHRCCVASWWYKHWTDKTKTQTSHTIEEPHCWPPSYTCIHMCAMYIQCKTEATSNHICDSFLYSQPQIPSGYGC